MKNGIVIEQDEDGKYVSHCPTLPGCWSQGDTREEAITNIKDAGLSQAHAVFGVRIRSYGANNIIV